MEEVTVLILISALIHSSYTYNYFYRYYKYEDYHFKTLVSFFSKLNKRLFERTWVFDVPKAIFWSADI